MEIESHKNKNKNTPKRSAWQMIQTYFNVLNHVIALIIAIYMSFLCYNAGNKPVSWHAWLCTIGVRDSFFVDSVNELQYCSKSSNKCHLFIYYSINF